MYLLQNFSVVKEVIVRESPLWRSLIAVTIGAGLALSADDALSQAASVWDWGKIAAGCALLLFVVSTSTKVALTEADVRISRGVCVLRWWVHKRATALLPWQEVNAVVSVLPGWLPLKVIAVSVGGRVFFLGTFWTSFKVALVLVVGRVGDEVVDEDVARLSARYRSQLGTEYT